MAILTNIVLESGIQVTDSYARIESIAGNKNNLTIYLNYYLNDQAAGEGKQSFKQTVHEFIPSAEESSVRWDKQAYEHIKTLPEFSSAVDA